MLLTTLLHHVWRKDKHLYVNYRKDDKYHDLSMTVISLTCFIFQTGLPAGVQTVTPEAISHILTFQPDIRVHPPKEPTKETSISGNKNTLSVILIGTKLDGKLCPLVQPYLFPLLIDLVFGILESNVGQNRVQRREPVYNSMEIREPV